MDNEVYTFAIKNTLNEIRNVCPGITSTFMFREDCSIIAGDEATSEKTMKHVVDSCSTIFEKADSIGGVKGIIIEGRKGRLNIERMQDNYLVTITSEKADMKTVDTMIRVMIPTILKLLDKICSTSLQSNPSLLNKIPKFSTNEKVEEPTEELNEENILEEPEESTKPEMKPDIEPEIRSETSPQESTVNQLIVENLGGLLVPSDTVRIDSEILEQWANLYEDSKIEEVEIGTFDGKITRCKVKPIKDSKYEGKGIIQMPEKVQLALEIKKGELVRARPIIESGG